MAITKKAKTSSNADTRTAGTSAGAAGTPPPKSGDNDRLPEENKRKPSSKPPKDKGAPLTTKERWMYGGLGASAPVAVPALTSDTSTVFEQLTFASAAGWGLRSAGLFAIGGFVAFMQRTETDVWRCFMIGISAPALLTSLSLGLEKQGSQPRNTKPAIIAPAPNGAGEPTKPGSGILFSSAYASETSTIPAITRVQLNPAVSKAAREVKVTTLKDIKESGWDQFVRGFLGSDPATAFIIVSLEKSLTDAKAVAAALTLLNACPNKVEGLDKREARIVASESIDEVFVLSEKSQYFVVLPAGDARLANSYAEAVSEFFKPEKIVATRQSRAHVDLGLALNPKMKSALEFAKDFKPPRDCIVP